MRSLRTLLHFESILCKTFDCLGGKVIVYVSVPSAEDICFSPYWHLSPDIQIMERLT